MPVSDPSRRLNPLESARVRARPLARRDVLRVGGALLSVAAIAPALASCTRETEVPVPDAGCALPIPPLLEPDADGRFDLTAAKGTTEFIPGVASATWGYNGQTYLGPTLRLQRGRSVEATIHNDTDEETTVHWHGLLVRADADGGPHLPVLPGESLTVNFTPDQPPATLWYHPHPHGITGQQVRRGLAGMLILDDEDAHTPGTAPAGAAPSTAEAPSASDEVRTSLPHEYGVDDIPIIIQDMRVTDDGELLGPQFNSEVGLLGQTVVTNGVPGAVHTTDRRVLRLRLLNGSQARSYGLQLGTGEPLTVIASEGGLLPEPVQADVLSLSPAERAEVLVEVPDAGLTLISAQPELGNVSDYEAVGGEDAFTVLRIEYEGDQSGPASIADLALPAQLVDLGEQANDGGVWEGALQRQFTLRGRQINGKSMDMGRIDLVTQSHEPEIWQISNLDSSPHNFHIHNAQFRILSIGGQPPPPEFAGWKDTVYTPPQRDVRIAVVFPSHDDDHSALPYMFHCHLMLHEDDGMMGHLTVDVTEQEALDAMESLGHEH